MLYRIKAAGFWNSAAFALAWRTKGTCGTRDVRADEEAAAMDLLRKADRRKDLLDGILGLQHFPRNAPGVLWDTRG